jgi:hypothetical protein
LCKSGRALTSFFWRRIASNFSAKSSYFLMSHLWQTKSLEPESGAVIFGANTSFNPTAKKAALIGSRAALGGGLIPALSATGNRRAAVTSKILESFPNMTPGGSMSRYNT